MARPTSGSTVHVGKAAALIVVGLLLGVIVLRDNSSGGQSVSADVRDAINNFTETTLASEDLTTTTLAAEREEPEIKVQAINATRTAGRAGQATQKLQGAGYNALQPGDATPTVKNSRPASLIYIVAAGFEREAQTLAAFFGLPPSAVRAMPSPPPSPDIKADVNLVVLVGTGITI